MRQRVNFDTIERVGVNEPFSELALTLLLFTHRLHRRLREEGASSAGFLAREGKFLANLFDLYQNSVVAPEDRITANYLLTSRRASYVASLRPIGEETFSALDRWYPDLSARGFLRSLGLPPNMTTAVEHDVGPLDDTELCVVRQSPVFLELAEEYRVEQRRMLSEYLSTVLTPDDKSVHLVDVGWKGSMQDFLRVIIDPDTALRGWYLGLILPGSTELRRDSTKEGLIFDRSNPDAATRAFGHFKSLYEILLNADHGSVLGYERRAGAVSAILDSVRTESDQHRVVIAPIQSGLERVFGSLLDDLGKHFDDNAETVRSVARHHARMVFLPTPSEVAIIDGFEHYENFGEVGVVALGANHGPPTRWWRGLATVARDPRRLYRTGWPPLELHRLGLRRLVPLFGHLQIFRIFRFDSGREAWRNSGERRRRCEASSEVTTGAK